MRRKGKEERKGEEDRLGKESRRNRRGEDEKGKAMVAEGSWRKIIGN